MVRFLRNAVVAKVAGADSSLLQISSDERHGWRAIADLFQRRRPGAASADHAAHPWRTWLPAGTALPPGTGAVEDGARAAPAADRAIAERSSQRSVEPFRSRALGNRQSIVPENRKLRLRRQARRAILFRPLRRIRRARADPSPSCPRKLRSAIGPRDRGQCSRPSPWSMGAAVLEPRSGGAHRYGACSAATNRPGKPRTELRPLRAAIQFATQC